MPPFPIDRDEPAISSVCRRTLETKPKPAGEHLCQPTLPSLKATLEALLLIPLLKSLAGLSVSEADIVVRGRRASLVTGILGRRGGASKSIVLFVVGGVAAIRVGLRIAHLRVTLTERLGAARELLHILLVFLGSRDSSNDGGRRRLRVRGAAPADDVVGVFAVFGRLGDAGGRSSETRGAGLLGQAGGVDVILCGVRVVRARGAEHGTTGGEHLVRCSLVRLEAGTHTAIVLGVVE